MGSQRYLNLGRRLLLRGAARLQQITQLLLPVSDLTIHFGKDLIEQLSS